MTAEEAGNMSVTYRLIRDGQDVIRPHGYAWGWDGPREPASVDAPWGTCEVAARFDRSSIDAMLDHWRCEVRDAEMLGYEVVWTGWSYSFRGNSSDEPFLPYGRPALGAELVNQYGARSTVLLVAT